MGSGVLADVLALVPDRILRAAAVSLIVLLLAFGPGWAQTATPPPLSGFVPPYEITRIVRLAGFDPLAPPLRERTTYVIRATDFRGTLMRVVVDARSGAIRAVNRIVSDAGTYGAVGMPPPPYGILPPFGAFAPYTAPSAYAPPEFDLPEMRPGDEADLQVAPAPAARYPAMRSLVWEPPLPRPRPPALAAHKATDDARSAGKTAAPAAAKQPPLQLPD